MELEIDRNMEAKNIKQNIQVPEVSDGGLVEVWVRGVGGKPSNKKKQVKLAFVKTKDEKILHLENSTWV